MRLERKFYVPEHISRAEVESNIRNHPAFFMQAHPQRIVNNIYLDSENHSSYFENINGDSERKKIRIRWYGNSHGNVKSPQLEIKSKKGITGKKTVFPIPSFEMNNVFLRHFGDYFLNVCDNAELGDVSFLKGLRPTLINSYKRNYFLDASRSFRLTFDCDIKSHPPYLDEKVKASNQGAVLELKYDVSLDPLAEQISAHLPYRMSKHSKYSEGMKLCYNIS